MILLKLISLLTLMAFAQQAQHGNAGDNFHARKAFVQALSNEIWQAKVKKVYVSDFTDESGKPCFLGKTYAATFAGDLEEASMGFTVIDRVQVRRSLTTSGLTDHDSADPEGLTKLVSDLSADAI